MLVSAGFGLPILVNSDLEGFKGFFGSFEVVFEVVVMVPFGARK